ncbi:MAG: hypothetical protein Q8N99_05260 [Nanoarchaeota archaeon]|nr:hypothetical protein [Nanoarchaeota archaeon]
MKNKRGQFYIIAAIIIVMALTAITSVVTYAIIKPAPRTVKDLSRELNYESAKVIDYGVYNRTNMQSLYYNFTDRDFVNYFMQKTSRANITFIYGNITDLNATQFQRGSSGHVSTGRSGVISKSIVATAFPIIVSSLKENVTINLLNKEYSFRLREGENFYFVITEEKEGEVFVETND